MTLKDFQYSTSPRDNYKIHILNSYQASKKEIDYILKEFRDRHPKNPTLENRSDRSLKNEWLAHNLLYRLGIAVENTRDLGLEYPQKWYLKIGYWIVGNLAKVFLS